MKVVTAKEFQTDQSSILKDVQAGQEYQITFHRRPIAKLLPIHKPSSKKPVPGSHAAFLESLKHTAPAKNIPIDADLDELRWQHMQEKYGRNNR